MSDCSAVFNQKDVNLDAQVGTGLLARDVLHQAVNGSLNTFKNSTKTGGRASFKEIYSA